MNSILRLTLPRLNLNVTQRAISMHSLSCLTVTVMSSNAPILFIHKFVLNFYNQKSGNFSTLKLLRGLIGNEGTNP